MKLPRTERFLQYDEQNRLRGVGAQVAVRFGRQFALLTAGSDGSGRLVGNDSLFPLYCAGKFWLGLACASLVAEGELSFEDRIYDLITDAGWRQCAPWLADVTVASVLCHQAGMHAPPGAPLMMCTTSRRQRITRSLDFRTNGVYRPRPAYSEWTGWAILTLALQEMSDLSLNELALHHFNDRLGVEDARFCVQPTPAWVATNGARIRVSADYRHGRCVPLLAERESDFICQWNPSFGAYADMATVGAIADFVARADGLSDAFGYEVRRTVASNGVHRDPVLRRKCGYGLGWLTSLRDFGFGDCASSSSFGQTGQGGTVFLFVDEATDLRIAAAVCAVALEDTAGRWREGVVKAIYEDCLGAA